MAIGGEDSNCTIVAGGHDFNWLLYLYFNRYTDILNDPFEKMLSDYVCVGENAIHAVYSHIYMTVQLFTIRTHTFHKIGPLIIIWFVIKRHRG